MDQLSADSLPHPPPRFFLNVQPLLPRLSAAVSSPSSKKQLDVFMAAKAGQSAVDECPCQGEHHSDIYKNGCVYRYNQKNKANGTRNIVHHTSSSSTSSGFPYSPYRCHTNIESIPNVSMLNPSLTGLASMPDGSLEMKIDDMISWRSEVREPVMSCCCCYFYLFFQVHRVVSQGVKRRIDRKRWTGTYEEDGADTES
jgi:hypothetical protein